MTYEYYVPIYQEVHLEPCPIPPSKSVIYHQIETLLAQQQKTMGLDEETLPTK